MSVRPEEGVQYPGPVVIDSCEKKPGVRVKNQTQVLLEEQQAFLFCFVLF